jgi:hypothetical protein
LVENPDGLKGEGGGVTTVRSTGASHPRLLVDLGIDAGGYVEVGATTSSGVPIHLSYSESKRYTGPNGDSGPGDPSLGNDDAPGSRSDNITAAGRWRSPGIRGAQRWISIDLPQGGTASIDYVRVREEHLHPGLQDYTGHFLSSDDMLNRIWYAGAYTYALDSYKDLRPGYDRGNVVVTDGAKRDRLVWIGDLVMENLLGDYTFAQAPQIMRDSLAVFSCQQKSDGELQIASDIAVVCPPDPPPAGSPPPQGAQDTNPLISNGPLPEYTAQWVVGVHDYNLYTGDDDFARRMLPVVRRGLTYFTSHLDANGLYSTPPIAVNWHPFDWAGGEDTHTNAVIYRALLDASSLERHLGAGEAAASQYERQAASLKQAMLAHLWDPTAGAFLLNFYDSSRNHTQDAQVEPVQDGIVTGQQARQALSFVSNRLQTTYGVANGEFNDDPFMSNYVSPYISGTELLTRLSRHETEPALDLLRREWGHMVDADPNTTLWEKVAFDGTPASYSPNQLGETVVPQTLPFAGAGTTSLSQGWSGGGSQAALSGHILGIRPATPGFATWVAQPQPGNLQWAQGQTPTRYGPIVVRWQRGSDDRSFRMTVRAPSGTAGEVSVPLLGQDRTIAKDGQVVWRDGQPAPGVAAHRDGDFVVFSQAAGQATYAWSN